MKNKNLEKKLALKKNTVVNLESTEMDKLFGGKTYTQTCPSRCSDIAACCA